MRSDPDAESASAEFGLRDVVALYFQQNGSMNQLWAMFAATTFAAGAFNLSIAERHTVWLVVVAALGFTAFAIGHLMMVRSSLRRMECAASDLTRLSKGVSDRKLVIINHLVTHQVSRPLATTCHIVIDVCVFGAFIERIVYLVKRGQGFLFW